LPDTSRRRVPGLRREEIARLAGISSDYYLRLEQGRVRRPSPEVIHALARALRLDDEGTSYLHSLSFPAASFGHRGEPERASASVERLIASWSRTPAYVLGRRLDVLASNAAASAISPVLRPGMNVVRSLFLDPQVRHEAKDWSEAARHSVARLRANAAPSPDDPELLDLVAELSARSDDFRRLWARHDVALAPLRSQHVNHPDVGPLELEVEAFMIAGADRQTLIVYHASPGSDSDRGLRRLADLVSR
jgi:transcriptional regulator with XRE-family HTH domain